jgi:ureidoglycolate hydrolase
MEITKRKNVPWQTFDNPDGWRVGILGYCKRFSRVGELERHNLTCESFILVKGKATVHVADKNLNVSSFVMDIGNIYTVDRGEWHHITLSEDALVLVVENRDTSEENTDIITFA